MVEYRFHSFPRIIYKFKKINIYTFTYLLVVKKNSIIETVLETTYHCIRVFSYLLDSNLPRTSKVDFLQAKCTISTAMTFIVFCHVLKKQAPKDRKKTIFGLTTTTANLIFG